MGRMFFVTKQIKFSAAHRLFNHNGDCHYLHGHNYIVELTFSSINLDEVSGMIIDFKDIKEGVGKQILEMWDHALLLNSNDNNLINFAESQDLKLCMFQACDPTAENMCRVISGLSCIFLCGLRKVKVWETDSCYAELDLGGDDNA